MLDLLLKLFCYGFTYLKSSIWHAVDAIVITAAFVAEFVVGVIAGSAVAVILPIRICISD